MNTIIDPSNFLLLIVDDVSANLKVLHGILSLEGYQISFANNGKQALERVENIEPDLILLDLMMPEIDGFEVAEILAKNPKYQDIPIIFLTASQEKEHLTQAFEKGAVDYITKPFNKQELLARIKTHLQLKHYRDCLSYQIQQEKLISQITLDILGEFSLENILNNTVLGMQKLFQANRVIIETCQGGKYCQKVAEVIQDGYASLSTEILKDWVEFEPIKAQSIQVLDSHPSDNLNPLQKKRLTHWNVKTELIASLMIQDKFCGVLMIHHCANSYQWSDSSLKSLQQIIQQTQIAIQQAKLYQELETVNQQLEKLYKQSEKFYKQLKSLDYYDELAQIPNRRQFNLSIEQEWLRLRRDQQPLSLIMCDIDFFKQYNDIYGHLQADDCLYQIAQTLKNTIKRPSDMVCRYGGEEFAVILPNTNQNGALEVANSIQTAITQHQIAHSHSPIGYITLSMGLATMIPSIDTKFEQLVQNADDALFLAKKQGRNQIANLSSI
ncbi:diguanylate cyclase domain-containing protein [Crocosphaera sp. XPORK-15E]|uniref:diguanylate cyclase domain-containing protein n=1 Tax=Crocosphaera sp. XPORK-15E TaxID=3110247 RepID=UPI002B2064F6|nr:diguanylate cyclase [Crocosphaera sp. XPORK-15E]MEA5534112.1 diguanylate cyclase [Crocosphaera sp. XPORK-15E]